MRAARQGKEVSDRCFFQKVKRIEVNAHVMLWHLHHHDAKTDTAACPFGGQASDRDYAIVTYVANPPYPARPSTGVLNGHRIGDKARWRGSGAK